MTEHSIEELEHQLKSAFDRKRQAELDVRAAQDRLQTAVDAASGLVGHVLSYPYSRGYGAKRHTITRSIIVDRVRKGYDGLRASGVLIVASGKPGIRRDEVLVTDAADLGRYVEAV